MRVFDALRRDEIQQEGGGKRSLENAYDNSPKKAKQAECITIKETKLRDVLIQENEDNTFAESIFCTISMSDVWNTILKMFSKNSM